VRVLVLAVGSLDVFLSRQGRFLVATEAFTMGEPDNWHVHVTNKSANDDHQLYDEDAQNLDFDRFEHYAETFRQMEAITASVFAKASGNKRHLFHRSNCYELFGLDFMVDPDLRVWLLEANPDPSMGMWRRSKAELIGADPLRGFADAQAVPEGWAHVYHRPPDAPAPAPAPASAPAPAPASKPAVAPAAAASVTSGPVAFTDTDGERIEFRVAASGGVALYVGGELEMGAVDELQYAKRERVLKVECGEIELPPGLAVAVAAQLRALFVSAGKGRAFREE
jgi:hypothetical protein